MTLESLHPARVMINVALTYDDIQLVPEYSDVVSRSDISLHTHVSRRYGLCNPLVASPMDTVCEASMASKMMNLGGVGCIHRFMSINNQCDAVLQVVAFQNRTNQKEKWDTSNSLWHAESQEIPLMAAVGVGSADVIRAKSLVTAGANIILIDVAHGHHRNVIEMIHRLRMELPSYVDIIAGSIATSHAAHALVEAGVDGLRCGVGGGSICSTRLQTGFGVPSVTMLEEISQGVSVPIMADGGIRTSGDIAKALALGADCVMLGSLLAGTDESPGVILEGTNGLYKLYSGSASLETKIKHGRGKSPRNIEGISTKIPYKGGAKYIVDKLLDGVRSALSYGGAHNISNFYPNYIHVTNAGIKEASTHIVNYPPTP